MNVLPYMYTNGAKGDDLRVRVVCCVKGCEEKGPVGKDWGDAAVLAQESKWTKLHHEYVFHMCPMHSQFFTLLFDGMLRRMQVTQ